jgi:hypothetical protein
MSRKRSAGWQQAARTSTTTTTGQVFMDEKDQGSSAQVAGNTGSGQPSNGMGIAGFVLALVALFLGWIPILGWVLWVLGLIFSAVGMSRKPKGLAIAGLVISLVGLIFLLVVFAAIGIAMHV